MNTAEVVANDPNELSCVIIPTPEAQLLLPNVCVAEIMPWRRIKTLADGPPWCMGLVGWRGQTVPVVHYAGFSNPASKAPASARCLVVMNRARTSQGPAFYAVAAVGLPRMVQLVADDLQNAEVELGIADVMQVDVGTEQATIPNLAFIEEQLADLMSLAAAGG